MQRVGQKRGVHGLLVALLLIVLVLVPMASAATSSSQEEGFNLTASPLPIDLTTKPGKSVTTDLRVQNSGNEPVKIKVGLLKFKASGDNGQPQLLKRGPGDDYFDWVTFSRTNFIAQPGVWNDVTMTVSPPADAAFGYYYAVVFSEDSANTTPPPTTGKLHGATATLVLLDVQAPGEKRQVAVTSFTASKKLYEYLPTTFTIQIRNTGNVHVVPTGDIFISRDHKHNLAVLAVNPNQGNILPNSGRIFPVDWTDGFPTFTIKRVAGQIVSDKSGAPIQQLRWDFSNTNKLRFGRYYAHLLLTYDDGTKDVPIDAEVTFWVIPWKLILLIVLVPLLPALAVYLVMRHRVKNLRSKRAKYVAGQHN
ncbi:MAG TPA: hypothetical protein VLH84_02530 [Patescibacteria group bacterium]|nr:hypothetical protein [Patescibacteria group bacterium]